ncbi:MAG: tRNA (N6-isopentenyl adenosine(37)-C2)-methylthiotransferase MiaB [Lachnospiraceae bacterium]|nr:tRNA (N6-isopentenyl adenosine(37)-C2)-methylthiotransferase MiaB [Lachnospiraceae bacterium]MDY3302151.1 tRNA (N6-isopentenyl adenosine(37)-C2)-methylthiotransferase MiaB [Lachnospiraceae bacterium]
MEMDRYVSNTKEWEEIPTNEPDRQRYFINEDRKLLKLKEADLGRKLTFHVTTFGCQMNARDSEKLRGILEEIGYIPSESEDCDLVIYNTCTVRENADNRVYGRLGILHGYKKKNPGMKIAVCGCMIQEEHVVNRIRESYRFVDLLFGTHNVYQLAELLHESFMKEGMTIHVLDKAEKIVEDLPQVRTYPFKAGVNIMYGCNNFCSYCIVPYVRGRERSRTPQAILREIEKQVEDGVVEVMLLGQNVNSYGKGLENPISFAELLLEIDKIPGLERIRFMTSHPKDLSQELIDAIAKSKHVCHHIHLPLQSGSSRLLKDMNRHYDKEAYLDLVRRIREAIPDVALTTDIIVGYPGETDEDFEETMDVVKQVGFDSAFTFEYSRRSGTPAATRPDQVAQEVVTERFNRLLKQVQEDGRNRAKALEGQTRTVLVEEVNREDDSLVSGRMENNSVVHFKGTSDLIGKIVPVHLTSCKGFYYLGEIAN